MALQDVLWSYTLEQHVKENMDRYKLAPRQREVCWFLFRGYNNTQIAEELGIALQTVKNHLHMAGQKMDVGNEHITRIDIVLYLIGWNMIHRDRDNHD